MCHVERFKNAFVQDLIPRFTRNRGKRVRSNLVAEIVVQIMVAEPVNSLQIIDKVETFVVRDKDVVITPDPIKRLFHSSSM